MTFLRGKGITVVDVGTESTESVDYPDIAEAVARPVTRGGEADAGIVIDGAGIGSTIAANKIKGIRAAMATSETIARYSREHNGANVLALGSSLLTLDEAKAIVTTWISTAMREPRYTFVVCRRLATSNDGADVTRDELQRLISHRAGLSAAQSVRPSQCSCHSMNADCCPSRLQA